MAEEAVATQEQGKVHSKTQELRDWLDGEVKRCEENIDILTYALSRPGGDYTTMASKIVGRYVYMTSDEREAKMAEDRKKLEELQKRLKLLRSAQEFEFGDTIEELERVFRGEFCLKFIGGGYNFIPPIITFSKVISANLEVVFEISLGNRILMVKHKALHDGNVMRLSNIRFPNLLRIGVVRWPENIIFCFESDAERSYLTFYPNATDKCFLS